MKFAIFITGTDTGAGKTVISGYLLRFLLEKGYKAITQKWVETGCDRGLSQDIRSHTSLSGKTSDKIFSGDRAPYILSYPASPHLAARVDGVTIDVSAIIRAFHNLKQNFDAVIVEGSGGALVPVNSNNLLIDITARLELPVLIIAENKLGAINHTLLTVESLRRRKIPVTGIVFNRTSGKYDEKLLKDNIKTVRGISGEKILGELPYNRNLTKNYEAFPPIGEKILKSLKSFFKTGSGKIT
ncbi:MAG: dethiobiotin synthase [Candidatus Omnitrophota bacterium]